MKRIERGEVEGKKRKISTTTNVYNLAVIKDIELTHVGVTLEYMCIEEGLGRRTVRRHDIIGLKTKKDASRNRDDKKYRQ
jgi:hypothetical protein